ncbi:MAG: hypothetical protein KC656_05725 [Myxococcales bacterium]|nr:hypothetical protein [Myxococcales bacterium]
MKSSPFQRAFCTMGSNRRRSNWVVTKVSGFAGYWKPFTTSRSGSSRRPQYCSTVRFVPTWQVAQVVSSTPSTSAVGRMRAVDLRRCLRTWGRSGAWRASGFAGSNRFTFGSRVMDLPSADIGMWHAAHPYAR